MKTTAICFQNNVIFVPITGTVHKFDSNSIKLNGRRWRAVLTDIELTEDQKNKNIESFIEHRKNLLSLPVDKLAIVPTADCAGRCAYCYAKSNRDNDVGFIEFEDLMNCLLTISNEYKVNPAQYKSIIIYGGEPFLYPEKLEKVISIFRNASIGITTGLLFSDELFGKLMEILERNPNVSLSCSIDPKQEDGSLYPRVFPGVEDVYSFLTKRIIFLISKFGDKNRIGLRMTITENAYNFSSVLDYLNRITGKSLGATIELVDDKEIPKNILTTVCDQLASRGDTEKLAPGRRFIFDPFKKDAYVNALGDCDQLFGRLTIDYKGRFHACSETAAINDSLLVTPPDFSKLEESRTKLWDKCWGCPFVFLCGGLCFAKRPTTSRCIWRQVNICEGLYHSLGKLTDEEITRAISISKE